METDKNTSDFWKGTHISSFQTSLNNLQYPDVTNTDDHVVLVKIPLITGRMPESFPSIFDKIDYWDQNHVKLPCSEKNLTEDEINRWNLIREALSSVILSGQQLETAILSYNKRYAEKWNFATLKIFFDEICDEEESALFFQSLLPKIIDLALSLPELITGGVPLLKQGRKRSITLSQIQIASLLANAFFCTFPHRNTYAKGTEYANYPTINFTRLFQAVFRDRKSATHEKIKCLLHYFRRVTTKAPTGVVTYSRNFVPNLLIPQWTESTKKLSRLYVSSKGYIEDEGFGLYQMDFAHKLVGGGVIANGCVQEEIRFIICPELILSRLFTECLNDNEALIVTGCERFSKYKGYGKSFTWDGDYVDETPRDDEGRKYCTVLAIDALFFKRNPKEQYSPVKLNRELNKAFAGFSWGSNRPKKELCGIASGNWGCGVYKGNAEFKSLLQMMAAAEAGRDLAYFTFGNDQLRDSMNSVHEFLINNSVTVGKIYNLLYQYNERMLYNSTSVYDFIKKEATNDAFSPKANENTSVTSRVIKPFGMPKLAVTKHSFCYRQKMANEEHQPEKNPPGTSAEKDFDEEIENPCDKVDDPVTKHLKQKESEVLRNMYATVSGSVENKIEDSSSSDEYENNKSKSREYVQNERKKGEVSVSRPNETVNIEKQENSGDEISSSDECENKKRKINPNDSGKNYISLSNNQEDECTEVEERNNDECSSGKKLSKLSQLKIGGRKRSSSSVKKVEAGQKRKISDYFSSK